MRNWVNLWNGFMMNIFINYRSNAKAVSSHGKTTGEKVNAMIESFHSVGWTMTLQDAKWMIDRWEAAGLTFTIFMHSIIPFRILQNTTHHLHSFYRILTGNIIESLRIM